MRSHGVSGYRAGCRCVTCVSAETDRKRTYRATGSGARDPNDRTVDRADTDGGRVVMGEAEAAVIAECESLPLAAERPASVMGARLMARILDDPEMWSWHGRAAKTMLEWMAQLHPQQTPRKTGQRLATVHALRKVRGNDE